MPDAELPPERSFALESTLQRLSRMIRAVGARHGVRDEQIEELLQDVRIRIWHAHGDGEEISRLPTSYVYRTAMSAAIDLVRGQRRREQREPSLEEASVVQASDGRSSESLALASDLGAAIARALDSMLDERRLVVRMHLLGYSRDDMRSLLGWSDAKIRNLLYRGLQDLRERLTQAGHVWPEDS